MGLFKNLVLPPWLNLKWIAMWLCGLAVLGLLYSWNERGHQVQRLSDFQAGVVLATSQATVTPDKNGKITLLKPEQVASAITGLHSSYVSAQTTIKTITFTTKTEKARADTADAKLAVQIANFNKLYLQANKRITFLENRPPVSPDQVCSVIKEDTNSAWDGWK